MPEPVTRIAANGLSAQQWNDTAARLGGSLYHTSWWRELICRAYPAIHDISVAFSRQERVVALLPLVRVRKAGLAKCFSMPFSTAGLIGDCGADVVACMLDYLSASCDSCKLTMRQAPQALASLAPAESRVVEVDLSGGEDEISESLSKNLRRDIRQKQSEVNMRDAVAEDAAILQRIYRARMDLLGSPGTYNDGLLEGLFHIPEQHRKITLFSVGDGPVVAFNIAFCFGSISYYFANASTPEHAQYQPNVKLMWEDLKWARRQGSKVHCLGGAFSGGEDDSLYQYKLRWGHAAAEYNFSRSFGWKGSVIERLQPLIMNGPLGRLARRLVSR